MNAFDWFVTGGAWTALFVGVSALYSVAKSYREGYEHGVKMGRLCPEPPPEFAVGQQWWDHALQMVITIANEDDVIFYRAFRDGVGDKFIFLGYVTPSVTKEASAT